MKKESRSLEEHILLVEDEPISRDYIKKILVDFGFRVSASSDADRALRLLSKSTFDLVISDMIMPGKSGKDLLSEVKAKYPHIPVIIISGLPRIETAVECMKIGAFDFVTKPFEPEKFFRSITKALKESRKIAQNLGTIAVRFPNAQNLAGYSILKTIGEGSMGLVFLVEKKHDPMKNHRFALKIIKSSVSERRNKKLLSRFFKEIDIISQLDHPHIVKIYEHGFSKEMGIPFYVMEFLEGNSLKQYTSGKINLKLREKVQVIRQIASALACAHKHGICHRDIKPANILLLKNNHAKLMDFGIARIPESELTQTKQSLGTPAYLAPESFNTSTTDFRSDLFSLGSLAYELFLGEKPFKGDSLFIIAQQILETKPLEPVKIHPHFPLPLQRILGKMLVKDPNTRYQSGESIANDLDLFLKDSFVMNGSQQNLQNTTWT